jgi:hypothetical protein
LPGGGALKVAGSYPRKRKLAAIHVLSSSSEESSGRIYVDVFFTFLCPPWLTFQTGRLAMRISSQGSTYSLSMPVE